MEERKFADVRMWRAFWALLIQKVMVVEFLFGAVNLKWFIIAPVI